jgi:peptidoglycan/LPS O-acetylase OafA/YrhL
MKRLHELDYLRGLAAGGIMLFHYLSWTIGEFSSEDFMGRVGLYGVSIFYILSGLTLYHVYNEQLTEGANAIITFFKRRVLRIYPLLWISTIVSIILFDGGEIIPMELALNLSGLFGFLQWDHGIAIGSWSIGNELVFYVFFPVFVYLFHKSKVGLAITGMLILVVFIYFSYFLMDTSLTLRNDQQQSYYCNPINQLFLFFGGYCMGVLLEHTLIKPGTSILILLSGVALFAFWPQYGDRIYLVSGNTRMVLTLSCFLICFGFYKFSSPLPALISQPLRTLGEISYSVYMLHPIVHRILLYPIDYIRNNYFAVPETARFLLAVLLTLLISYFVYHTFEKFFIRLGKKSAN